MEGIGNGLVNSIASGGTGGYDYGYDFICCCFYSLCHPMIDYLSRIVSASPITPRELRCAALFVMVWFVMDFVWFVGTILGWY